MLWIALTVVAAPLQVARNVMQRGLVGDAGPWGATLVRFLFGLPLALAIFAALAVLTPDASPTFSPRFAGYISLGALSQVCATATLLLAIRGAGLGVATVMQQSSLPLSALMGYLLYGDNLHPIGWIGVAATTAGLVVLSWPKPGQDRNALTGAVLGFASGLTLAVTLNAYRQASLTLEPEHLLYAASASVCVAQALQSLTLTIILALSRPSALRAVAASWRKSLSAGLFGGAASACWFAALALAPAAQVRAVGVLEMPVAAAVGRRLFSEQMSLRQIMGALLAAAGVVATALG